VRLREHEHAGDGAVGEDAELLPEHGRAAGGRAGVEDVPDGVAVGQDRRVAHPRVECVEAHRSAVDRYGHRLLGSDGRRGAADGGALAEEEAPAQVEATPRKAAKVTVICVSTSFASLTVRG
jgi:hypothetical protein